MNALLIVNFLKSATEQMNIHKDDLIQKDSIVGDGDLGLTMSDGFTAAYNAIKELNEQDCGRILYFAGKAMSTAVPSTMGTLMASGLMEAGKQLKGVTDLSRENINTIFSAYLEGVMRLGKASIGEKTFVDGLAPAVDSLRQTSSAPLKESAEKAAEAALRGYEATKGMLAIHGRAATRGEASRDLLDPGAYVAALLMKAFADSLTINP